MQFLLTVKDITDFTYNTPAEVAKELEVVLENEGYNVGVAVYPITEN